MPENGAEQAAEQAAAQAAEAAPAEAAPSGGRAPIFRAIDTVRAKEAQAAQQVVSTAQGIGGKLRQLLRFEKSEPAEVSLAKTPVYAAGHVADGTILNVARRGLEVVEPLVSGLRAAYRSTIGAILSPIKTLSHSVEYVKGLCRTISSQAMAALNVVRAPIRAADDVVDRGVEDTVQQVNFKLSKIPVIGSLISKPTNFVAKIASQISGAVRGAMDWITSPIDTVHEALAPA